MLKSKLLSAPTTLVLAALTLGIAALPAQAAHKSPAEAEAESLMAAITGTPARMGRQSNIPAILSENDEQLYRAAFQAQARGQNAYADRMIAKIHDPILMGPLLAQRYLADGGRSQAGDLRDWLNKYSDQADADAIYRLARQRGASDLRSPSVSRASLPRTSSHDELAQSGDFLYETTRSLSSSEHRRLDSAKDRFRAVLRREDFDKAAALLDGPELQAIFDKIDYDEMKTVLAQALFAEGRDAEALRWAKEAAERSGDLLPEANWMVGLTLWRMNQHGDAARYFEAVANGSHAMPWLNAAGAYWAARANLAGRHPEVVNHWLLEAAACSHTFYGFLARRALGQDMQYSWDSRPFTDLDADTLSRVPAARRALALLQVGRRDGAEDELRALISTASPGLVQSMLSLAATADMPALTVDLGGIAAQQDGRNHDSASYPVPDWRPTSGWSVDRALMLGIARQESDLNPHARSPSGAVGLMQLMPSTARIVGRGKLTDPNVSLELGQRYIRRLLDDPSVKGNLLFLAASYNSGPGNLARWQQSVHHNGDPLLFVESIPVRETRFFVQRVLTNYWTYRNRLGQDAASLDTLAAGNWPMYDGMNTNLSQVRN